MTDLGKIDADTFEHVIANNRGALRPDVRLGPTPGIDFGVLTVDDRALVCSTDPLSVPAALGHERGARLATDIVLADVAVSGVPPEHLAVGLNLPSDYDRQSHAAIWRGIAAQANAFDVSLSAANPGRYPGVDSSWMGGATAIGIGAHTDVVRPDGARPGDALVISTGPGAEVAGLFAHLFPHALDLDEAELSTARERLEDIYVVEDALAAHAAGQITAMHDATEGGIAGGLIEMATGAGVRFELDRGSVPVRDGVSAVCQAANVDPWQVTSCGTLLITVKQEDARSVVTALETGGAPAAIVGQVSEGKGVIVDGERLVAPETDPSWDAAADLAAKE
ncbi:MAG: AIR synthase-related protein [Salinirussus sp.]